MKTPRAEKLIKSPPNLFNALKNSFQLAEQLGIPWIKLLMGTLIKGPKMMLQLSQAANASESIDLAINEGDCEKGVHLVGQVQGRIKDIPTVAEVMARIIKEANDAKAAFS